MLLSYFKPTWMIENVYSISPAQLKEAGIRAVFSDLDNTLIAWNDPNGSEELHAWMKELEDAGIPLIVISNNSAARVKKAVAPIGLPYISRSMKPLAVGINRARKKLGLKEDEVVMVGDQLMTDMAAAHSAGVRSILVKPLLKTDKWNTRFNRFIEKFVMMGLKHQDPNMHYREGLNDGK